MLVILLKVNFTGVKLYFRTTLCREWCEVTIFYLQKKIYFFTVYYLFYSNNSCKLADI
jgi:hypothetical protein